MKLNYVPGILDFIFLHIFYYLFPSVKTRKVFYKQLFVHFILFHFSLTFTQNYLRTYNINTSSKKTSGLFNENKTQILTQITQKTFILQCYFFCVATQSKRQNKKVPIKPCLWKIVAANRNSLRRREFFAITHYKWEFGNANNNFIGIN